MICHLPVQLLLLLLLQQPAQEDNIQNTTRKASCVGRCDDPVPVQIRLWPRPLPLPHHHLHVLHLPRLLDFGFIQLLLTRIQLLFTICSQVCTQHHPSLFFYFLSTSSTSRTSCRRSGGTTTQMSFRIDDTNCTRGMIRFRFRERIKSVIILLFCIVVVVPVMYPSVCGRMG